MAPLQLHSLSQSNRLLNLRLLFDDVKHYSNHAESRASRRLPCLDGIEATGRSDLARTLGAVMD